MMNPLSFVYFLISLLLAPVLPGLINKVKAFFGGKKGPPVMQLYYDIAKLLQKSSTYSQTSTMVTKVAPFVILFSTLAAGLLVPIAFRPSTFSFAGDIVLMAYLKW